MNNDMSDIIEFSLATKCEYNDEVDQNEQGTGTVTDEDLGEDADSGSNNNDGRYVVFMDDIANDGAIINPQFSEYQNEEFLIVTENGHELYIDESGIQQQQLDGCTELQNTSLLVPKTESFEDEDDEYILADPAVDPMDDFVEEDQIDEELDSKYNARPSSAPLPIQIHSSAGTFTPHIQEQTEMEDTDEERPAVEPSNKMLSEFKGPRRYLLFDDLVATIVDFDEENTPIVEFAMISNTQDEKLPVECGICPDVMHKSKLARHHKTHMVPGTNRYACIYCTETYRDCKYLAGHARRHMGIRPYVCEPCKLYFSTKQDLRVHNQRRHLEKGHICELCGKTFSQNTQLKRHREATHDKMRRFQCEYCQKSYYKNFSLQEHMRNVHFGKRRMLKCPFCGMQCRDAHKMARHRKENHLNQDTYKCHLCKEEFTDINYFDAHKRSIQCRSNTRRRLSEQQKQGLTDADQEIDDIAVNAGVFEETYDEDAGLLVETEAANVEQPIKLDFLEFHEPQQQIQMQYGEPLLVEGVNEGEGEVSGEPEFVDTMEMQPQYQQYVQQDYQQQADQSQATQDYNGQLVYEITLESEDN